MARELRQFGGSFAHTHAWLVSYRSLAFKLGPQYLCLNPATEQFREPADGFHTRCFLVPIEVHSDSDRTLQPARQVAAEESLLPKSWVRSKFKTFDASCTMSQFFRTVSDSR